jgi:uncharacterized protein YozE (UPF0346 family)
MKEGTRRYMATYSSEELIGNHKYFADLYDLIKTREFQYSFYHYLMNYKTPHRLTAEDIPITRLMKEAFVLNKDPIEDFIAEFVHECDALQLYENYKEFMRSSGLDKPNSKKSFQMKFSRLMTKYSITSVQRDRGVGNERVRQTIYKRINLLME